MARPTKLTPALGEKICSILAGCGCSMEAAAAAVGITGRTLYEWRTRGMIETEGDYFEFSQALARARAESEAQMAAIVATAAKTDWRAASFILERRFPDTWGNRLALVKQLERMTDDELDAFIAGHLEGVASVGQDGDGGADPAAEREPDLVA